MGNLLAECQKCSVVIDQCEGCELLPRRERAQGLHGSNGASGSSGSGSPSDREGGAEHLWLAQQQQRARLDSQQQQRWTGVPRLGQASQRSGQDVDGAFAHGPLHRLLDDGSDATLQAAIAASHASMPPGFGLAPAQRQTSEEEVLAQAIAASKAEEENRDRAQLREEQSLEYEESLRVDRERVRKQKEEEQKRRDEEEVRDREEKEQAEAIAKAEEQEKARIARVAVLVEEARGKLREEPPQEEPGRVTIRIRIPEGRALKRSFRSSDTVDQLYIYTIVEGGDLASENFRLISTMPRNVYDDREAMLQDVGLHGPCALLVEIIEPDEPVGE